MKIVVKNFDSANGIRVIVDGDVENEKVLQTGEEVELNGGIIALRELGLARPEDMDPSRLIGD